MNTDLKPEKLCLTSSPTVIFAGGPPEPERKAPAIASLPSLAEMLDEIGPLPKTSLFFGQAEDGLPVLLDLTNPRPGPILVEGGAGAGKTRLLRVIAQFIAAVHRPQEVQYGVIASRPEARAYRLELRGDRAKTTQIATRYLGSCDHVPLVGESSLPWSSSTLAA